MRRSERATTLRLWAPRVDLRARYACPAAGTARELTAVGRTPDVPAWDVVKRGVSPSKADGDDYSYSSRPLVIELVSCARRTTDEQLLAASTTRSMSSTASSCMPWVLIVSMIDHGGAGYMGPDRRPARVRQRHIVLPPGTTAHYVNHSLELVLAIMVLPRRLNRVHRLHVWAISESRGRRSTNLAVVGAGSS